MDVYFSHRFGKQYVLALFMAFVATIVGGICSISCSFADWEE